MTTPPAPAPAPVNAAAAAARSSRTRWLVSAIVVLVMAVGGALAGRMLRPATPILPTAYPVLPATSVTARDGSVSPVTAQAPLPTGYAVQPAVYAAAGAPPQPVAVGGGMTIGAGRPVANPGGAPDLRADPEAGVPGAAPARSAPPAAPDVSDDIALRMVTTRYEELTGVAGVRPTASGAATGAASGSPNATPSGGTGGGLVPGFSTDLSKVPIRAFTDPCVLTPNAPGCGAGVSAIVLGIRQMPEFQTLWVGQVRRTDLYAGECARQFPLTPIDWASDSVFAVAVNQPVVARLDLQLRTPGVFGSAIRISHQGALVTNETATPSADIAAVWVDAFERGAQTPAIPLCLKVSRQVMETNRDGCLGEFNYYTWQDCTSTFTMSVSTGCGSFSTDPLCEQLSGVLGGRELPRVRQGPFGLQYSYDPQWANWDPQFGRQSGLTEANQRRPVRLTPVDALNLEVAVPTHSVTLSDPTAVNANNLQESRLAVTGHAMVAAAGYAPGTDCRTVDPSIASTTLPVTRQGAQTRYWTPDPGAPASREGVINLTMPQLAAGEAVDICVFWYQLPTRSYDSVVVTAIERHTVVPPARAATELAFVGVGRGGDAPGTPAGSIEAELARWTFQVIGDRPLTTACGFPSGNAPDPVILRPLGDPGFLCRIGTSAFLFEPRDIELFTTDITTNRPEGRTRIHIDNRGCSMSDCGAPRRARIELSDGTWMDLSVRKVPFATTPMLPGGRIAAQWSADQWQIDPSGFQGVIPTLRTPVRQSAPALDTFGLRVRPNEANPSSALDLTWQADREATVMVSARALVPAYLAPTCQDTLVGPTQPANSGVLTVPGLCPNTEYAFAVTVVDATTGASQVYDWARGGTRLDLLSGLSFNLIGRTRAPVLPPEFIASWSVSAADPPLGSPASLAPGPTEGTLAALTVRIGEHTLVSRTDAPSTCTRMTPGTALAGGFDSGQPIGQMRIQVAYTLVAPGAGNCAGPAGVTSFSIQQDVVWDGRSERSYRLSAADGRTVVLTLRPATRD